MRWILIAAAIFGASSIVIGASLKHLVMSVDGDILQTALRYHQLHSVVLLALGFYGLNQKTNKPLLMSALLFSVAIVVFSGGLYSMVILNIPALAMLTPIGGVIFIFAWLSLAFIRKHNVSPENIH